MSQGRTTALLLALLCLLSGGCAALTGTGRSEAAAPSPATAITLSVLSDAVYLVEPATGRRAEVVGGLFDFQSGYATWSPDHRRLAYANRAIYVIDFVKDNQRVLVRGHGLSMPTWNSGADEIVYGDGASMWRAGVTSGAPVRLRLPPTLAPLGMDWGRHGLIAFQGLVWDCNRSSTCSSTERSEIWVLDPDRRGLRQVTRVGHAESPKWSSDSTRILFIRRFNDAAARELWVVNADGTGLRKLSSARNVVAADWSPDGFRLAMVRASGDHTLQIWTATADGSNARPLGGRVPGDEATLDW
jgi:Tol biopolymer transport system component